MTTNPVPTSGFDAGLEQIHYTLKPYIDKEGIIPEPSGEQMQTFIETLRQVMPIKTGPDGKDTLDLEKVAEAFNNDPVAVEAVVNHAISEVCSGEITAEELKALPYRVKQRFYGWLMGTLLSPEA